MGIKRGTSGLGTLWKTDPEKARGIASKGGKTAHQKGTAYEWTVNEAREASQLGAIARAKNRAAKLDAERVDRTDRKTVYARLEQTAGVVSEEMGASAQDRLDGLAESDEDWVEVDLDGPKGPDESAYDMTDLLPGYRR